MPHNVILKREFIVSMKGKDAERWLTYVLDHIKETKEENMYKLLPEFKEDNI